MDSLETAPVVPLLFSASIAFRGFKKNSLSLSGALAAFLTGAILLSAELRVFGIMMLVFYFVGSWATKKGKELKEKYEDGVKEGGGQRDAFQVLSNSLPALIACIIWRGLFTDSLFTALLPTINNGKHQLYDPVSTCAFSNSFGSGWSRFLLLIALGQFGCCLGDTLASELGILSKSKPTLITTLKTVPPGTNGGMSALGTGVSILGGGFIGLVMVLDLLLENAACRGLEFNEYVNVAILSLLAGGLGSLIDSLLGATVQQTKFSTSSKKILTDESKPQPKSNVAVVSGLDILTNNQVNLVSSVLTAILIAYIG